MTAGRSGILRAVSLRRETKFSSVVFCGMQGLFLVSQPTFGFYGCLTTHTGGSDGLTENMISAVASYINPGEGGFDGAADLRDKVAVFMVFGRKVR